MNIEQVKAEAKKQFDKDLTDEQAQALLEAHPAGELSEEELNQVSGGLYRTPTASRGPRGSDKRNYLIK